MSQIVLIIEDRPNDAFSVERAVEPIASASGFVVKNLNEAESYLCGVGAFADRDRFPFPMAVIAGLRWEPKSGLEFLEWLRRTESFPLLPLFFLTASFAARDRNRIESVHGVYIFEKPSDAHELECLIRIIVGHVVGKRDDACAPRLNAPAFIHAPNIVQSRSES